ncbi:MAG: hypothetical protein KDK34_17335, partial [Leptospiraceae bacterium]|nr:hypothetical protein [Leptospiraceae bacterium]
ARFAPGGIFVSERSYGLVAGGKHEGHGLETSPLAMYVRGSSRFDDALHLRPGDVAASSIAVYFPVDSRDVYAAGDLVVAAGEKLRKSREYGSVGVVGVVVAQAGVILGSPADLLPGADPVPTGAGQTVADKPEGMELIGIAGIVDVHATAESGAIEPGDLLVTSLRSEKKKKMNEKRYRPGTIIARALAPLKKGEGIVRALLVCA